MIRRLSLRARLLIIAALTSVAALLFASVTIGHVLEEFVVRGLDQTLDTQIGVLTRAVRSDGSIDPSKVVALPGFDRPETGWIWRVRSPAGQWSTGSPLFDQHFRRHWKHGGERILPGEGRTADGRRMHLRRLTVPTREGEVEIIVSAPRELVDWPLLAAQGTLLLSLGLIGLGLAAATWIQLRYGLGPVRSLGDAVARVRMGAAENLPTDQPAELRPLAEEVNALIEQNRAGLEHARRHVANLAHGLKTPLATLSLRLSREGAAPDTLALVGDLDARIAHHLKRARSAAPTAGQRARSPVGGIIQDLVDVLLHLHAERRLDFDIEIAADTVAAVEHRDLEEMLGNLLENACRHAAHRVTVSAYTRGPTVIIAVDDDGPGLNEEHIDKVTKAGVRLDESGAGYGFGLSIVTELAELYGGELKLGRSETLGGLSAHLSLARVIG